MSVANGDMELDNPRLREMIARLSRLVEISVTLNSSLELKRVLQFIIDSAADLLESEGASILLVDERTQELYFAASTGSDPEELARIPVPLEGSIAGTIYREDRPLIINNTAADPRHFREVGERIKFETRSLIGVPMRIRDKVTGVLEAVNKKRGEFDQADVKTMSIIASQAAVAVNNARLVEALRKAYSELRKPLGLILGYAAILQEEADAAASEHAAAVLNSALRMRALIESMTNMNLMKVGSGELVFQIHPLSDIAKAAYDEVAGLIRAKGQRFELDLPHESISASVDAHKLTMALTNLLNNAMRFTPEEGHIGLALSRRGSEGWFRVGDDGVGIPADEIERIFDEFYQVENHLTRRHQGLGLGLSIVKAIAEAHGGRVWAESAGRAQGSDFTLPLPLQ